MKFFMKGYIHIMEANGESAPEFFTSGIGDEGASSAGRAGKFAVDDRRKWFPGDIH